MITAPLHTAQTDSTNMECLQVSPLISKIHNTFPCASCNTSPLFFTAAKLWLQCLDQLEDTRLPTFWSSDKLAMQKWSTVVVPTHPRFHISYPRLQKWYTFLMVDNLGISAPLHTPPIAFTILGCLQVNHHSTITCLVYSTRLYIRKSCNHHV